MFYEYPRHVHKAGGEFLVVEDDEGKAAALADGWSLDVVLDAPVETAALAPIESVTEPKKRGRPRKVVEA